MRYEAKLASIQMQNISVVEKPCQAGLGNPIPQSDIAAPAPWFCPKKDPNNLHILRVWSRHHIPIYSYYYFSTCQLEPPTTITSNCPKPPSLSTPWQFIACIRLLSTSCLFTGPSFGPCLLFYCLQPCLMTPVLSKLIGRQQFSFLMPCQIQTFN